MLCHWSSGTMIVCTDVSISIWVGCRDSLKLRNWICEEKRLDTWVFWVFVCDFRVAMPLRRPGRCIFESEVGWVGSMALTRLICNRVTAIVIIAQSKLEGPLSVSRLKNA